jgi:hypothetical protein
MAIGFPLFNPECTPIDEPSYSEGKLVKIVSEKDTQVMLLTDATINRGSSGGMIADFYSGTLLGLITSNLKLQSHSLEQSSSFPNINFSIPLSVFIPLLKWIGFSSSEESNGTLESIVYKMEDEFVSSNAHKLWKLEEPLILNRRHFASRL